jgi:hypothetical protein
MVVQLRKGGDLGTEAISDPMLREQLTRKILQFETPDYGILTP